MALVKAREGGLWWCRDRPNVNSKCTPDLDVTMAAMLEIKNGSDPLMLLYKTPQYWKV